MNSTITRTIIIISIILLNFSCDQVTKSIVRKNIGFHEQIEVIDSNFILTKVENKGAFLSMGNNMPYVLREILLSYLPLLMLILAIIYIFRKTSLTPVILISMCFVVGGGIGNIFDRILHGSVTDFMHMDFYIFRTGIFNMADVSIMIGSITILLYYLIFNRSINSKKGGFI